MPKLENFATHIKIDGNPFAKNAVNYQVQSGDTTVDVSSTDANDAAVGTGLRTLRLFGLDGDGNNQNEIITLDGQTEVTSALLYSAVQGFRGLTSGSNNSNEGIIYIGNGTFTAGVPDTIYGTAEIGHNKGLFAYYTVPTAKELFLRQLSVTMVGSNKEAEINVETSADGIFWITENPFGFISGADFQGQIIAVPGLTAGNHLRIHGEGGGGGTEITTILGCELVDV